MIEDLREAKASSPLTPIGSLAGQKIETQLENQAIEINGLKEQLRAVGERIGEAVLEGGSFLGGGASSSRNTSKPDDRKILSYSHVSELEG